LASFGSLQKWDAEVYGYRTPESEFHQTWNSDSSGRPRNARDFPGAQSFMAIMTSTNKVRVDDGRADAQRALAGHDIGLACTECADVNERAVELLELQVLGHPDRELRGGPRSWSGTSTATDGGRRGSAAGRC